MPLLKVRITQYGPDSAGNEDKKVEFTMTTHFAQIMVELTMPYRNLNQVLFINFDSLGNAKLANEYGADI